MIRNAASIFFIAAALCICACGGRPRIPEAPIEDPGPSDNEITAEIFEECALEGLGESLTILRSLRGLLDPDVLPPAINVSTIDLPTACVNFVLDADFDGSDDTAGSICFLDPLGSPAFPFDVAQLDSLTDLQLLLADAPDGSSLVLTLTRSAPLRITISVSMLVLNGAPLGASGRIDVVTPQGCSSTYLFSDVQPTSLLGDYPNAIVTASVDGETGDLSGTISLNGTENAVVTMALDDGSPSTYRLNLDTFELTLVEAPPDDDT